MVPRWNPRVCLSKSRVDVVHWSHLKDFESRVCKDQNRPGDWNFVSGKTPIGSGKTHHVPCYLMEVTGGGHSPICKQTQKSRCWWYISSYPIIFHLSPILLFIVTSPILGETQNIMHVVCICICVYIHIYIYSIDIPMKSRYVYPRKIRCFTPWCCFFHAGWPRPPRSKSVSSREALSCGKFCRCTWHRIGWWENLQERPIFDGKNHGFL